MQAENSLAQGFLNYIPSRNTPDRPRFQNRQNLNMLKFVLESIVKVHAKSRHPCIIITIAKVPSSQ